MIGKILTPLCASAILHVVIEVIAEEIKSAENRRTRHIDQRAISLPAIEIQNLLKLVEQRGVRFTLPDPLEHCGQHRRLHAASGTLAAAFAREELRDLYGFLNHAGSFRIKTHHSATERGTCPAQ